MERVHAIFKPSDLAADANDATRQELQQLFAYLFPNQAAPQLDKKQSAFAVVAVNPRLALMLAQLTIYMATEMPWTSRRSDLRELATQTLNFHLDCPLSYASHLESARSLGISDAMIAATPDWRDSTLFDVEQKLIVEYTLAVIACKVPEELFARLVRQFGEKEAVECTTAIALWAFWAMVISATCP